VLERIGFGPVAAPLLWLGRWPLLAALMMAALALIYRYSPSGGRHRWRCLSWGAVFATLLWLGASLLFSAYVANFADYADTYGALAGVVVMLLWLWLGAYAVLLGAEINAALDLPEVAA
jgi:membrane protein